MDSGWSVIIGAAIALIGAFLGAWAQSLFTARAQSAQARRQLRTEAIREVTISLVELEAAIREGEPRLEAASNRMNGAVIALGLSLKRGERGALTFVQNAFEHLMSRNCPEPAHVLDIVSLTLLGWNRGGLKLKDFAHQDLDDFKPPRMRD
ncbi:hypothetical protein [Glaciibacter superstes]|uniref:hypothetical protein n=1 Tax=Glaciibacter superstes TaxID=501023 RepID=UPI0003B73945|nr:hypothetical protein [Glaciibacter superstes]